MGQALWPISLGDPPQDQHHAGASDRHFIVLRDPEGKTIELEITKTRTVLDIVRWAKANDLTYVERTVH